MQLEHQNDSYEIMHAIVDLVKAFLNPLFIGVGTLFALDVYLQSKIQYDPLLMINWSSWFLLAMAAAKAGTVIATFIYSSIRAVVEVNEKLLPVLRKLKRKKKN